MNKTERIKRNQSIKDDYKNEMGEPYIPLTGQSGSDFIITKLAKKHKLSKSAIYLILKYN